MPYLPQSELSFKRKSVDDFVKKTTIKKMALLSENSGRSLPDYETQAAKMKSFSPYADNGG